MKIPLKIEPDWAHSYLTNISLTLLLNWIHSFVLKLVDASSRGLVYIRQVTLDVNMLIASILWIK